MAEFEMDIQGVEEAVAALERLGSEVDGAMEAALETAALEVVNEAKRLAPYSTGTLRRSITHQVQSNDAIVGPLSEVPYAARIEFGFTGTDSLGRSFNQAPQPYMRPALERTQSNIRRVFVGALNDIMGASTR